MTSIVIWHNQEDWLRGLWAALLRALRHADEQKPL